MAVYILFAQEWGEDWHLDFPKPIGVYLSLAAAQAAGLAHPDYLPDLHPEWTGSRTPGTRYWYLNHGNFHIVECVLRDSMDGFSHPEGPK